MESPQIIDLSALAKNHSDEIGLMIAAIENPAGGLWTLEMRASVRGGKPLGEPRIEDQPDSNRDQ